MFLVRYTNKLEGDFLQKYIEFKENNDHEGEEWSFFVSESPEALKLKKIIKGFEDEQESYSCEEKHLTEKEVKILLKRKSKTTYMKEYNLVTKLNIPEGGLEVLKCVDDLDEYMYKGKMFETK